MLPMSQRPGLYYDLSTLYYYAASGDMLSVVWGRIREMSMETIPALRSRLAQIELELQTTAVRTRQLVALRRAIRKRLVRVDGPAWPGHAGGSSPSLKKERSPVSCPVAR
jgi:hypothetical protein